MVKVEEIPEKIKNDFQIIDIRNPSELERLGQIKVAKNWPLDNLRDELYKLDKEQNVILHCFSGARAKLATTLLKNKGFDNVAVIDDSWDNITKTHPDLVTQGE